METIPMQGQDSTTQPIGLSKTAAAGIGGAAAIVASLMTVLAQSYNTPKPPAPPPSHPVQFINIAECQYLVTENPFFILHRGDCTNHARFSNPSVSTGVLAPAVPPLPK